MANTRRAQKRENSSKDEKPLAHDSSPKQDEISDSKPKKTPKPKKAPQVKKPPKPKTAVAPKKTSEQETEVAPRTSSPGRISSEGFRFLDLPIELRNEVYEYNRPPHRQHFLRRGLLTYAMNTATLWKLNWTVPMLLVNHQIRAEALRLLYTRLTPVLQMDAFHRNNGLPDTIKWLQSFGNHLAALRYICFCAKLSKNWIVKFEIDFVLGEESISWLLGNARWDPPLNNWKSPEELGNPCSALEELRAEVEEAFGILNLVRKAGKYSLRHLKLFIDVFYVRCNSISPASAYKYLESKQPLKDLRVLRDELEEADAEDEDEVDASEDDETQET